MQPLSARQQAQPTVGASSQQPCLVLHRSPAWPVQLERWGHDTLTDAAVAVAVPLACCWSAAAASTSMPLGVHAHVLLRVGCCCWLQGSALTPEGAAATVPLALALSGNAARAASNGDATEMGATSLPGTAISTVGGASAGLLSSIASGSGTAANYGNGAAPVMPQLAPCLLEHGAVRSLGSAHSMAGGQQSTSQYTSACGVGSHAHLHCSITVPLRGPAWCRAGGGCGRRRRTFSHRCHSCWHWQRVWWCRGGECQGGRRGGRRIAPDCRCSGQLDS